MRRGGAAAVAVRAMGDSVMSDNAMSDSAAADRAVADKVGDMAGRDTFRMRNGVGA
ncbi:hypothetical protein GCM10010172_58590 [Paractinoplanes ferrugineus]|uniref:Uncharacterized protein n=1 Tax=Paractinoplanes ferrugineus TaxID=113564 RepID=A0A919J6R7_9ACTN|nr:hypothetical protein Afe05nite_61620 [Actinoplanes ferrugineus]